ncbi:helicase-related protein [Lactococcus garvieae]|uniref:helicase-related protein n=1 Tax=Lactococcus garvieae TaxID=1363 RepID=UPI003854A867
MAVDNYVPKIGDENRIDNKERTMRGAIAGLMAENGNIKIASGYFRLSGITELEDDFRNFFSRSEQNKIELLLSNQYDTKNSESRKVFQIAEKSAEYSTERFYLDNQFYQQLVEWIHSGRIEVKIFVDEKFYETHSKADIAFLHGKAYMFSETETSRTGSVLIGSSNFTYGGLVANRELNIFSSDSFPPIRSWFDEMWNEYSVAYADELIADLDDQKNKFAKPKVKFTPVEYFYWNLGKYFGKKAPQNLVSRIKKIEQQLPYPSRDDGNKFFAHQFYGIQHVYQALKEFDTQVLADGVGLGKTLEAASIIKLYLQDLSLKDDKRKILILANNRLREQWLEELKNVGIGHLKFDITTRQKFTGLDEKAIHYYAETYALVVIDEAHEGFLRQDNKAYKNMKEMIRYAREVQSRTLRGLLLTATPWNNSREDVIRLGLLFLNLSKVPTSRQYYSYVLTNREKILYDVKGDYNQEAYIEFWKDLYYQRTRASLAEDKYLSDRYPSREFPLEDGETPFTISYSPEVSNALSEILERLITLNLPYQDTIWQYFGPNKESNVILRQRFQLLRRADSSNAAFGISLRNIKNKLEKFQAEIQELQKESISTVKNYFYAKISEEYADTVKEDEDSFDFGVVLKDTDDILNKAQKDRIRLIDEKLTEQSLSEILSKMLEDSNDDIRDLDEILLVWEVVSKQDEKQKIVISQIKNKVLRGEKVLVFSEFADTVEDYFKELIKDDELLSAGVGMIHGGLARINYDEASKVDVLGRFSPISKSYKLFDNTEISVLVGTDAISTGQNLQDAGHVMTIELPYNPMRLEQRIGRIDRPKSNGENKIFVYAFPSEEVISAELKLSVRFEGKATGATVDTEGDFKLPFINKGQYKGIIPSLKDEDDKATKGQEELVASVSEFEARERVKKYYDEIGDDFIKDVDYYAFPYSFSAKSESLLLAMGILNDINEKYIEKTVPQIWDLKNSTQINFIDSEYRVRELIGKTVSPEIEQADEKINQSTAAKKVITERIVSLYNSNLKSVNEIEQQPTYILELRSHLIDNMRSFRTYFGEQGVNGKEFKAVADSLSNRGFTAEQLLFLRNLRDENGQLSTTKITQNIWKNLKRFIEVFTIGSLSALINDEHSSVKSKANSDTSKIEIIAGILEI